MEDSVFKYWTGLKKSNYLNIIDLIGPAITCKSPKTALRLILLKLELETRMKGFRLY